MVYSTVPPSPSRKFDCGRAGAVGMCMLCVACNNPLRALLLFISATGLIDRYYLVWLAVFAVSMSFMDHRRDKPHVEQG